MSTSIWFGCGSGIAGDMALAALVDAGVSLADVEASCRRVDLPDRWTIGSETVLRAGVSATHVRVDVDPTSVHHRSHREIADRIGSAGLEPRLTQRSLGVFAALAEVEGAIHGVDPSDVEFHEVGATDSIVDIVGACAALELLDTTELWASPVAVGHGTIRSAHGSLPNPPPAVSRLLAGVGAPVVGVDLAFELTTPTGAALLAALASGFGPPPAMTLRSVGFGAGGRDLPGRANVTQVLVGARPEAPEADGSEIETLVLLETTLDDVSGELLGQLVPTLLSVGALDVWIAPVTMKKGRPGHVVSALCRPVELETVRRALVAETATLGTRHQLVTRRAEPRRFDEVEVDGHRIRVKVSAARAKPEHDDVVRAAAALGVPLRDVADRAEVAWRQSR